MKLVYITSKKPEAEKIAETLLKERLIACANMFPVNSCYRWKGRLEKSKEIAIVAKTRDANVQKIIKRVKELHSYEMPCIIALDIEGDRDFLKWVEEETR